MKRKVLLVIAVILTLALLVSACAPGGNGGGQDAPPAADGGEDAPAGTDDDGGDAVEDAGGGGEAGAADGARSHPGPFGRFDPPITVTIIRNIDEREYEPGDSWDYNIWTRMYEEKLGITFDYLWTTTTDFDIRLNTAIVAGDLPDVMRIPYAQFAILAASDRLEPLDGVIDRYAIQEIHDGLEAFDGILRSQVTFEGHVMGIGSPPSVEPPQLWFRDDWAAAVGADRPETFEDVIEMAIAFATQDPNGTGLPTVGFGLNASIWDVFEMGALFSAYGAYPRNWVRLDDGTIVHGSTQLDLLVEPLQLLQDLFADGILDQDFVNIGTWDIGADHIIQERIGMVFGPIWFGDWRLGALMEARGDREATWTSMPIPGAGGRTNYLALAARPNDIGAVSAGFAYPEVLVKMVNVGVGLLRGEIADGRFHSVPNPDGSGNMINNFFHNLMMGVGEPGVSWNYHCAVLVTEALETGDTSQLNDEMMNYYTRSRGFLDGTNLAGYTSYSIFGPTGSQWSGQEIRDNGWFKFDPFFGPFTDTMNENLGNINSRRDEIFTRIIMGADIDEGLQEYIQFWYANFGDVITEEVNQWYQEHQAR